MNILVLFADDWRYDTLGCAGHPIVKTPQLDRLASEGVRFTHSCVTTSICGVSRASLFTGQWMSRHGNKAMKEFKTPWSETYPGLLRDHGYYVGHVGKWHNGEFPAERFDFGRSYHGKHWFRQPDGAHIHVTQRNENDALDFLRTRPNEKPFCLTLAFFATHAEDDHPEQFLPQPESMKLYRDATIPLPPTASDEAFRKLPAFFDEKNEGRVRWRWRFDQPEKYQRMMKNYYRLATEVDATCGRILEELKRQGILENTLVVFMGDNGYFHGEHGLADKWYPHQESIRVPLIIRDPRLPEARRGITRDEFALNVDIAPTILEASSIKAPTTMQGRDLSPLYRSEQKPTWRSEFLYEFAASRKGAIISGSRAVVQKDWKYFYWPDHNVEQLFHVAADPFEQHDLANHPEHAKRLTEMRERMAMLVEEVK